MAPAFQSPKVKTAGATPLMEIDSRRGLPRRLINVRKNREGKIEEGVPVEWVANALVQAVANVVGPELKPERENPGKKIGAGELWIIHKPVAVVDTLGGAIVRFARRENVGVFGQAWYDGAHSLFLARVVLAVARHGEVKK